MARKARNKDITTLLSVTQKSNSDLFRDDQDRNAMLSIMKQTQAMFGYECFAYCLLDDHIFKMIINTKGRSISAIMSSILMAYSSYRKYEGRLFSGRFTSVALYNETQLEQEIQSIQKQTESPFNSFCFHCLEAKRPDHFTINLDPHNIKIGSIDSALSLDEAKLKLESWMKQKGCDPTMMKKNKDMRNQCILEFRRTTNCSLKILGELFFISESSVSKILNK
ncbi:MAG: hypothetical protein FD133_1687 [Erysipelotrichaceae bacterium]|nr:MAG: hypothetical protein FD179_1683 [Erysipelotrichaceae bacterium]TXT16756.1 MAG: hypothetical protein FD133_1687 [Erysipelotrichaceae bacterium]